MTKLKGILALLLAAILAFSLIACNGTTDGSTVDNDSTVDNSTPEDDGKWMPVEGANGDPNLRLPKMDLPTTEFRFLNHWDMAQPEPDKENAARDVYKIKYTTVVVAPEEKLNKFVSMVMGGDSPDILIQNFMPSLVTKGYLQPWDPYIDFSIGLWDKFRNSIENLKFKGAHYTIDLQSSRWESLVWYNTEIFEENGVKTPREYYEEGNWTWDTFREVCKELTIDADSNGEPEIYGAAIDTINAFIYTTGKEMVTLNADGTVTNNIKSEPVARAIQFFTDLYVKDKVVYQGGDGAEQFAAAKTAIMVGPLWYRVKFVELTKKNALWFVPAPKDPQADKYYIYEGFGLESLAKDCPNPQAAAAYMCAVRYDSEDNNDDPEITNEELMEKEQWTIEMRDWLTDEFYKEDKVPVQETWITFGLGTYWGDIFFRPRQGEAWATIAEELAPKIDADIARVMEG